MQNRESLLKYQVKTHQILECYQVYQNMSQLNFHISVYTFTITNTNEMDSTVSQKCKIENHYSNINHTFTTFKGIIMLITEAWKFYGTTKSFKIFNVIIVKLSPYKSKGILRHYHNQ